ncbi:putative signal transducing protein [Aurantivibrio plasticivorans]
MLPVYDAQNGLEAHMILNLLQQAGIDGRVEGELLQGGVGELQAMGIVRVMVDEEDYHQAKQLVDEWERTQPIPEPATNDPTASAKQTPLQKISTLMLTFLAGVAATTAYYHSPVQEDGIDYNGDGQLDEIWTYVNSRISKTTLDRNFDGQPDYVYTFDRRGILDFATADNNFDGNFETRVKYIQGNPRWEKSDSTGDGFYDIQINYLHGQRHSVDIYDSRLKRRVKSSLYGPFKLKTTELDSDLDGKFDTFITYDRFEEIESQSKR